MSEAESRPLPAPPPSKMSPSHKALAGLLGFLLLAKIVEMVLHVPFLTTVQQAVFSWRMTLFIAALALLGSGFAHIVGFPGMWEEGIGVSRKIWLPLAAGIVFGVVLLFADRSSGFATHSAAVAGVPTLALPFRFSVLFQLFAGVCAAILYNLFALAFTVWFVGTLILARRWPSATFWVLALLVSLWEPYMMASQGHGALIRSVHFPAGIWAMLALYYVVDLTATIFIRRFGFTAALVWRLSAVMVWHFAGRL